MKKRLSVLSIILSLCVLMLVLCGCVQEKQASPGYELPVLGGLSSYDGLQNSHIAVWAVSLSDGKQTIVVQNNADKAVYHSYPVLEMFYEEKWYSLSPTMLVIPAMELILLPGEVAEYTLELENYCEVFPPAQYRVIVNVYSPKELAGYVALQFEGDGTSKLTPVGDVPVVGGGSYPYSDDKGLDFTGYTLGAVENDTGQYHFVEITEDDMPMYMAFCDDGSGSYHPAQGLRLRMDNQIVSERMDSGSFYHFAINQAVGSLEEHKNYTRYKNWKKDAGTMAYIADYLLAGSGRANTEINGLIMMENELCAISSSLPGCSVVVSRCNDLSLLDGETAAFIANMKEIYGSGNVSMIGDCPVAITYFYQTRLFADREVEERFIYYAYFEQGYEEFLVQLTSDYEKTWADVAENSGSEQIDYLESQEQFITLLLDLCCLLLQQK